VSMLVSISRSSHFPRLRRFSRVYETLSRFSGPRRGRQTLIRIIPLWLQRIERQGHCTLRITESSPTCRDPYGPGALGRSGCRHRPRGDGLRRTGERCGMAGVPRKQHGPSGLLAPQRAVIRIPLPHPLAHECALGAVRVIYSTTRYRA